MNKLLLSAGILLFLAGCNQESAHDSTNSPHADSSALTAETSPEQKEERNKEIALASVKAVETGNMETVLKDLKADATDYGDGMGPVINNKDTLTAWLKSYSASFPDWKGENLMAVADGDYVFIYGDWSGTFKKDFMGIKATGKSYKMKDVDIFKFNDKGEIIEHRSIQDWNAVMAKQGFPVSKK